MTEERLVALVGDPGPLLLVEDDDDAALAIGAILGRGDGARFTYARVASLGAALDHLRAHEVTCVLLDLTLPDADALDAVQAIQDAASRTPIVVLAPRDDEVTALAAVQLGAQDELVKHRDDHLLTRAVRYAIARKRTELQLAFQTDHDPLTGLPARQVLVSALQRALAEAVAPETVALVLLDLCRFKLVNDVFGHDQGDRLLADTAERLRVACAGELVARLGGDTFVVLLGHIAGAHDAVAHAERALAAIAEPYELAGGEVRVGAVAGIALGSARRDARGLLRDADAAMNDAKRNGPPAHWAVFDETMRRTATQRLRLENGLRRAVDHHELLVHYQPWVALADGRVAGVEALVRWDRPEHGIATPSSFIGTAEETGLIGPFGAWVLERACEQAVRWQRTRPPGAPRLRLAVNVSARQLQRPNVVATVAHAIERSGIDPADLSLELTETVLIDDEPAAERTIAALRGLGASLAIDDFGTGYASLSLLKRLPFDTLKIDRSFIDGLGTESHDTPIVGAILELAHALGVEVVAEGVETPRQLEVLRELGCRYGQGFHFARPACAEEIGPLLTGPLPVAAGHEV